MVILKRLKSQYISTSLTYSRTDRRAPESHKEWPEVGDGYGVKGGNMHIYFMLAPLNVSPAPCYCATSKTASLRERGTKYYFFLFYSAIIAPCNKLSLPALTSQSKLAHYSKRICRIF
jgi:hypothetical protein